MHPSQRSKTSYAVARSAAADLNGRGGSRRALSPEASTIRANVDAYARTVQEAQPGEPTLIGAQPEPGPYAAAAPDGTMTLRKYVDQKGPLGRCALGLIESLARTLRSLHRSGSLYLGLCPDSVLLLPQEAQGTQTPDPPRLKWWLLPSAHSQSIRKVDAAEARTLLEEGIPAPPADLAPYLSPEQYDPQGSIGERADIFALGSLLCFLLTGKEPPLRSVQLGDEIGISKLLHDTLVKLLNRLRARRAVDRPTPDEAVRTLTWLARLDELMNGHCLDGRYRIERPLAKGGMNALFVVRDTQLDLQAVLKCPFPDLPIAIERARQEAEAATVARRGNSAVVHVLAYGEFDTDVPYLLMEMVDGELLTDRQTRSGGTLPEPEVLQLGLAIAETLDEVHKNGVIHRDLKPDNIILERDRSSHLGVRVRILDFGIARLAAEQYAERRRLTGAMSFMGTPDFMAPEQAFDAAHVGPGADVYALGVILYSLRGGAVPATRPFTRVGSSAIMTLLNEMLSFVPASRPSMSAVALRLRAILNPRTKPSTILIWGGVTAFLLGAGLSAYSAIHPGVPQQKPGTPDLGVKQKQLLPIDLSLSAPPEQETRPPVLPSLAPYSMVIQGQGHIVSPPPSKPPPGPKPRCAPRITASCVTGTGLSDPLKQIIAEKANQAGLQLCGKRLLLTKLTWYVPDPEDEDTRHFVSRLDAYWTIKNLDRNAMPRTIVISCQ